MIIYNAKIITMANVDIENGYIITDGDKIAEVGTMSGFHGNISDSDVNAEGLTVYPGFIDSHTHLGIVENGGGMEGDDGNEESDPCSPQLRAIDAVNPNDYCFSEAARNGITTVATGMGSANPVGGQLLAMKTYGSRRIEKRVLKSPVAIKFALGENPKVVYRDRDETPVTRMATAAIIREQMFKAKKYMLDLESYEYDRELNDDAEPPDFDFKCESLLPLVRKEIKAHFHCHRADDIFTALRICKEFDIDCVLIHCTEGAMIADELGGDNAQCVVGPLLSDRSKPELRGSTIETTAKLVQNGVTTAICSDHPENPIQYLPIEAGIAMRGGLSEYNALRAITTAPAEILGLSDRIGSIEAGKDADLVLYRGSFYDPTITPELVIINGEKVV